MKHIKGRNDAIETASANFRADPLFYSYQLHGMVLSALYGPLIASIVAEYNILGCYLVYGITFNTVCKRLML